MHPILTAREPGSGIGYRPYFYQAGHYLWRPLAAAASSMYTPRYREPTLDMPDPSAPRSHQTVEDVIAHGYFRVPPSDGVTAILTDRAETSRLGLDDVVTQVRRRYELFADHLRQIDSAMCAAANAIYQHEAYVGPANSRQHYAKHKSIQDLYVEKRQASLELWRDVSRLRLLLPENAQHYLAVTRKLAALAPEGGP